MTVVRKIETQDHEQEKATIVPCCATHEKHDHEHGLELIEILRVVFVALAAAAVWFHLWEPFPGASVIGLAGALVGGYPIVKEAIENIFERRMTMELSMTSLAELDLKRTMCLLPRVSATSA